MATKTCRTLTRSRSGFRGIYEDTFTEGGETNADKDAVAGEAYAKVIDNLKRAYIYMSCTTEDNSFFDEEGDTFRIRFQN